MSAASICGDNRFELIAKARAMLVEDTNIEDRPDEMAILDSILFRCWQMGWLDRLGAETCHNASKVMDEHGQARFACSECGAWIDSRMLWNPEYRNGESPWVSDCKLNYCPNCGRKVVTDG